MPNHQDKTIDCKISPKRQAEILDLYIELDPEFVAQILLDLLLLQRIYLTSPEGTNMYDGRKAKFNNSMSAIEQLLHAAIE